MQSKLAHIHLLTWCVTKMPHSRLPRFLSQDLQANLYPRFHPAPALEKMGGLHVAAHRTLEGGPGRNPVGHKERSAGLSPKTRPPTVSFGYDQVDDKTSTRRTGRGSSIGAPPVSSKDRRRKVGGKQAQVAEHKGRESMAKRDEVNALLALYQQRYLPLMSTTLTSDLL